MNPCQHKVLVIEPLPGMGDLFWFDAAFQTIAAYRKVSISLLTKKQSQADKVYKESPYVKDVIFLDRTRPLKGLMSLTRLASEIRKASYTEVWILHKSWRYVFVSRLAGIKKIFSFPKHLLALHPTERAEALFNHYDVPFQENLSFFIPQSARKAVQKFLPKPDKPSVVLAIGGTEDYKKWNEKNWVRLGLYLSRLSVSVSIIAGTREEEEAGRILKAIKEKGGEAAAYTGFTILQSLAYIDKATCLIGNDTGIMNGAVVLDKATFALFMGSTPLTYRKNLVPITLNEAGQITVSMVQEVLGRSFDWAR